MKIMLILNSKVNPDMGIVVHIKTKTLSNRIKSLLAEKRLKEAFNLLKSKATPESCVDNARSYREKITTLVENELV